MDRRYWVRAVSVLVVAACQIAAQCDYDEEWKTCGEHLTCDNVGKYEKGERCFRGCFCKYDYIRNKNGKCIPEDVCGEGDSMVLPIQNHTAEECPENEIYTECSAGDTCEEWCNRENPAFCPDCVSGCICKKGYIRIAWHGECIPAEHCPEKDSEIFRTHETGIGKHKDDDDVICPVDEVFSICRGHTWCQASCNSLHRPYECPYICYKGCKCKEGYVRNKMGGDCIPEEQCSIEKKKNTSHNHAKYYPFD